MSDNRNFSRIVGVVSLCKRDPASVSADSLLISRRLGLETLFVQVWVLRLPHTMMSACSRLTALPAQFARGRTASLTARTAKFTAQVRQHIVHGPSGLDGASLSSSRKLSTSGSAATEDRNLSCSSERQKRAKAATCIFKLTRSIRYCISGSTRSAPLSHAKASLHDFKGRPSEVDSQAGFDGLGVRLREAQGQGCPH